MPIWVSGTGALTCAANELRVGRPEFHLALFIGHHHGADAAEPLEGEVELLLHLLAAQFRRIDEGRRVQVDGGPLAFDGNGRTRQRAAAGEGRNHGVFQVPRRALEQRLDHRRGQACPLGEPAHVRDRVVVGRVVEVDRLGREQPVEGIPVDHGAVGQLRNFPLAVELLEGHVHRAGGVRRQLRHHAVGVDLGHHLKLDGERVGPGARDHAGARVVDQGLDGTLPHPVLLGVQEFAGDLVVVLRRDARLDETLDDLPRVRIDLGAGRGEGASLALRAVFDLQGLDRSAARDRGTTGEHQHQPEEQGQGPAESGVWPRHLVPAFRWGFLPPPAARVPCRAWDRTRSLAAAA